MKPGIDYSAWQFWFNVAQWIVTVFVALYVWLSNRGKIQKKDIEDVKETITCIGTRVTKLETGAISKDDLTAVYDRVNSTDGTVQKLDGKMDGVIRAVDRIQEHLLNNGGKS